MDSTKKETWAFLNAEDICKILRTAKESGVELFECGPLSVHFGARESAPPSEAAPGAEPPKSALPLEELHRVQQQVEETSLLEEEITTKEARAAALLIEDPLAYEQLLAEGELEGAGKDGIGEEALGV